MSVSACSFTHSLILFIGIICFGIHFQLSVCSSVNRANILQSFLILNFWGWSRMGGHAWGFIFSCRPKPIHKSREGLVESEILIEFY